MKTSRRKRKKKRREPKTCTFEGSPAGTTPDPSTSVSNPPCPLGQRFDPVLLDCEPDFIIPESRAPGDMARIPRVILRAPSPLTVAVTGLVLAMGGAGCALHMCNDEISPSGRYQATIVEVYDTQTTYKGNPPTSTMETCAGSDGLGAGSVLEVQAKGTVSNQGCKVVAADITGAPTQISLIGPPETQQGVIVVKAGGTGFMIAGARVSTPAGEGDLVLDFRTGGASGGIFATPVPGDLPPVVLQRTFYPGQDPLPRCLDQFVVHLVKE